LACFIGHLIAWQLIPPLVASVVAQDLLLGSSSSAAVPAEEDAEGVCGLLHAAGGRLHAAPGGECRLRNLCERLQHLRDMKRLNSSPINPKTYAYCERVRHAMEVVLDRQAAGWSERVENSTSAAEPRASEPSDRRGGAGSPAGQTGCQEPEGPASAADLPGASAEPAAAEVAAEPAAGPAPGERATADSDDSDGDALTKAASAEEVLTMLEHASVAAAASLSPAASSAPEAAGGSARRGGGAGRGRRKADKTAARTTEQPPWASLLQKMRHESAPCSAAARAQQAVPPADTGAPEPTAQASPADDASPSGRPSGASVAVALKTGPAAACAKATKPKDAKFEDDDLEWVQICADAEAAAAAEDDGKVQALLHAIRKTTGHVAGAPVAADGAPATRSPEAPEEGSQQPRRRWTRASRAGALPSQPAG